MITAVLDTNVLVSAAVMTSGSIAQTLDLALSGAFQLVLSSEILVELKRTLRKPYFAQCLTDELITQFPDGLESVARLTPLTSQVHGVASHAEDDAILSTAVSAAANYLITGDKALQALGAYRGVTVLSPSAFVQLFEEPGGLLSPT
jgi:putative PIN family toxin of toxin-antitoxin system